MRVLVAPDLVERLEPSGAAGVDGGARPSLSAIDVAAHLADGWTAARPADEIVAQPLSAGARGLLDAVRGVPGAGEEVAVVRDAYGAAQPVTWLRTGATGYLEVGELLGSTDAPDAANLAQQGTSAGAGDLLLAAVRAGVTRVVIGVGEGAVHDAGVAALRALVSAGPDVPLREVVASARRSLSGVEVVVAAATDLPLTGLSGAGAAAAGRPGIDPALAQQLEHAIARDVAEIEAAAPPSTSLLADHARSPRPARAAMSGAGGGLGLALAAVGARLLHGAEVVTVETEVPAAVERADLVLTACSRLDGAATDIGVPAALGRHAMAALVPVVAVAPEVLLSRRDLSGTGIEAVYPLDQAVAGGLPQALVDRAGRVARTWSR